MWNFVHDLKYILLETFPYKLHIYKVKLSLCLVKQYFIKTYAAPFLTSALEASGQLHTPGRFTHGERIPVPIG
jgi:hypothetical protein